MNTVLQEAQKVSIEYAKKARKYLADGDLEQASYFVDKATSKADAQSATEIDELKHTIEQEKRKRIRALESKIQDALNSKVFDEGNVEHLLDQLESLDVERAVVLRQQAAEKAALWQEYSKVMEAKTEIEELLERASDLREEGSATEFVLDVYEKALEVANVARVNYPNSNDIILLHSTALGAYNNFRRESNLRTTLGATGAFRQALADLDEYANDTDKKLPVYDLEGRFIGNTTVPEARRAYTRQANQWVQGKTPEKLEEARRALRERHSPEAAMRVLDEFKLLTAGLMPVPEQDAIDEFVADEIVPAQEKRDEARDLLEQAEGMPQTEVMNAWRTVQQVRTIDSYVPRLDEVQKSLRDRLKRFVQKQITDGYQWLADQQISEAQKSVDAAQKAAALDDELADLQNQTMELIRRIQSAAAQIKDVESTLDEIEALLARTTDQENAGRQAMQMWSELKDRLGEDLPLYPQVDRLSVRIGKFLDLAQLTEAIDNVLRTEDEAAMEASLQSVAEAIKRHPTEKGVLEKYETRLKARLAFLKAEREFVSGSLSRARDLYQAATNGDDAEKAKDRLNELRAANKLDIDAQRDLQQARRLLEKNPEEAYNLLTRWRKELLPSRDSIADAWQQLSTTWVPKIEKSLQRLLSAEAGSLDIQRIQTLVEALTDLGAPQAESWREKAIPRCYAELAENLEELENWSGAVEMWRKARDEASSDTQARYHGRWANAQLQHGLCQLDISNPSDDNLQTLQGLEKQFPRSAEVKLHLAKFYLARKAIPEAKIAAERGTSLDSDGEHQKDFQQITGQIKVWETILSRQDEIKQLLVKERSAEDYDKAVKLAKQLVIDYPDLELSTWWRELRLNTTEQIEQTLQMADPQETAIWEQLEAVSKILCLDPNHSQAKNKLRQLSVGVGALKDKTQTLVIDPNADKYAGSPEKALDWQLGEASKLLEQARQASHILERFGSFVAGAEHNLEQLAMLIQQLTDKVEKFKEYQIQCTKVQNSLSVAKSSGNWASVEAALNEIKTLGYDQHKTSKELQRLVEINKSRRNQLERLKTQIEEDWKRDCFDDVLIGLTQMKDPATGDHEGEYGISPTIALFDQYGRKIATRGIRDIEQLVKTRKTQVDTMEAWLQRLDMNIDWETVHAKAQMLIDQAHFNAAIKECQSVAGTLEPEELDKWLQAVQTTFEEWQDSIKVSSRIGSEADTNQDMHIIELPAILTMTCLQHAVVYLAHPPIAQAGLLSRRAKAVGDEANDKLAKAQNDLLEAQQFVENAGWKKKEWDQALAGLGNALAAYNRARPTSIATFFRRWTNKAAISQTRQRVSIALNTCKRLCPHYPALAQIERTFHSS